MSDSLSFIHSALDDAELTPQQFRVYAHITRRAANANGEATCGIESMAEVCKIHPDTVRACLKVLYARRMIAAHDRPGKARIHRLLPPSQWMASPPESKGGVGNEGIPPFPRGGKAREGSDEVTHPSVSGDTPPKVREGKVQPEGKNPDPPTPQTVAEPPVDSPPAAAQASKRSLSTEQQAERDAKLTAMLEVGDIMHRQPETRWSDDEKKALAKVYPNVTPDARRRVKAYYAAHWPPNRENNILRHDVLRLVRHWAGELDRANIWLAGLSQKKRERLLANPSTPPAPLPAAPVQKPSPPVPLDPPTPERFEAWKRTLFPPQPDFTWDDLPSIEKQKCLLWVWKAEQNPVLKAA